MVEAQKEIVLDKLVKLTTCDYMTDLTFAQYKLPILCAVQRICLRDYSLQQWSYAFSYIARREMEFRSYEELDGFLQKAAHRMTW